MPNIYAGGARRSAAPSYIAAAPTRSQALTADDVLMHLLMQLQLQPQAAAPKVMPQFSPTNMGGGDSSGDGGGGSRDIGGTTTSSDGTSSNIGAVQGISGLATAMQSLGILGKDMSLMTAGKSLGQVASIANAVTNPSVTSIAPIALSQLGLSAPVAGGIMGGINGGVPGAVKGTATGMLAMANPAAYALNSLSGLFGGPTLNDAIGGPATTSPMGVPHDATGLYGLVSGLLGTNDAVAFDNQAPDSLSDMGGGLGVQATAPSGLGLSATSTGIGLSVPGFNTDTVDPFGSIADSITGTLSADTSSDSGSFSDAPDGYSGSYGD